MTIVLGIDTGGTYTDAVLVDLNAQNEGDRESVVAHAKALTTRRDLSIGISAAIETVLDNSTVEPVQIGLVALSTTLATNAIVEDKGGQICLILVGYDPELLHEFDLRRELAATDIAHIRGGHDGFGDEIAPLDEDAVREAIRARLGQVEAFAVSSYFSVRNPAHELRVRELVAEITAQAGDGFRPTVPVTCGHELTSRLNSVRRAATAALNARLIPLLQELISTVGRTLSGKGINAPLMVVKGDGSLVRAPWALRRPIETVLSGPAASVVGAWHLAGRQDVWVVDMGGTTTDIAPLHNGRPRLDPQGAQVGRWKTMVEAVDAHTVGLGGDSEVHIPRPGGVKQLTVGPQRVVPLCMLASQYPTVVHQLRQQQVERPRDEEAGVFVLQNRRPRRALSEEEDQLWSQLKDGPRLVGSLIRTGRYGLLMRHQIERMSAERMIMRAGLTPTDALHCLGRFQRWDAEAARLGAELLSSQLDISPEAFCEWVISTVQNQITTQLITKLLGDEDGLSGWQSDQSRSALLARALNQQHESDLRCQLILNRPIVAIGAPVEAYFSRVGEQLHTEIVIPPYAQVANAVGAVVGGVVLRRTVLVHPVEEEGIFRVHLSDGVHDFSTLSEAVDHAEAVVRPKLEQLARQAGAEQVEIGVERRDSRAPIKGGWGTDVFLATELHFSAVGRPGMA